MYFHALSFHSKNLNSIMSKSLDSLNIPEKTKHYVKHVINPVLEDLVTKLVKDQPENPSQYMYEHLRNATGVHDELLAENRRLKVCPIHAACVCTLNQSELAALSPGAGQLQEEDASDNSDEEDGDEFDENKYPLAYTTAQRGRSAVSAEVYGDWNRQTEFVPPVNAKSEEQKARITEMLSKSFLFTSLDAGDLAVIIDGIEEVVLPEHTRVINQGEMGDFLFVVEHGTLHCLKKLADIPTEKVVKVCEAGDVFGELSLLYNAPRAASVECVTACTLWKLDQHTFTHIVRDGAARKRERYETFLKSVPLLSKVGPYELSQIADALRPRQLGPNELIVTEGDDGDGFYILEQGSASAVRAGCPPLAYSKPGDYFGELALLRDEPRAATVTAGEEGCQALFLDRRSFKRLLGSLDELLTRDYTSF